MCIYNRLIDVSPLGVKDIETYLNNIVGIKQDIRRIHYDDEFCQLVD
jgi:hypothetical protein